jgi:hypothetical protein
MTEQSTETQSATDPQGRLEALVMPGFDPIIGFVSYDVRVTCPHCGKQLHLNQHPYSDDRTEYCPAEDELGMALFGETEEPAKWENLSIEYKCCWCKKIFHLNSIEY